jgi:hypothetical protein
LRKRSFSQQQANGKRVTSFCRLPHLLLRLTAKKEARAEAPFRRCQRVSNDSHTARLQLLDHQTISIVTLRLNGPAHARVATDHLIRHVPQPALQVLQSFIRYSLHSQRRSQHLCVVEEIALHRSLIY